MVLLMTFHSGILIHGLPSGAAGGKASPMTAKKKAPGKAGRPSSFTHEISDEICEGLMDGKSLVQICQSDSMPNRMTVIRWMDKHPEFAACIVRAREEQGEYMDHLVNKTADECTPENAQAARVKIAAYQWRAAKLKPKKFGDKLDLNAHITGEIIVEIGGDEA